MHWQQTNFKVAGSPKNFGGSRNWTQYSPAQSRLWKPVCRPPPQEPLLVYARFSCFVTYLLFFLPSCSPLCSTALFLSFSMFLCFFHLLSTLHLKLTHLFLFYLKLSLSRSVWLLILSVALCSLFISHSFSFLYFQLFCRFAFYQIFLAIFLSRPVLEAQ